MKGKHERHDLLRPLLDGQLSLDSERRHGSGRDSIDDGSKEEKGGDG
jgi:hypothetical protein